MRALKPVLNSWEFLLTNIYLSFNDHISHVCAKISKSLFCINRIKNFVNKNALMLYYAMIHSHLSYCLNIYGSANTKNLQRPRIKQKEALRAICNAGYRDHTKPLFKSLKMRSLNEMIKYANLKFMHSFVHNNLPLSFHDMWVFLKIEIWTAYWVMLTIYLSQPTILPHWKDFLCSPSLASGMKEIKENSHDLLFYTANCWSHLYLQILSTK